MIKEELKKLWQNKMLLITSIVICFIPIMYAAFFLKGVWDPYGNLDKLPVAVVNNDQAVETNGTTMNVGQQLVDNLKKNTTFKWDFVDADTAKRGMDDNKYYLAITIPQDFSAKAATVTDADPAKMNITYETNASLNYPIETVGTTAVNQLKAQVQQQVTVAYANSIISTIKTTGEGLQIAADGADQLHNGINQVDKGVDQLKNSTPTLASGVNQLSEGSNQVAGGVNQVYDQMSSMSNQLNSPTTYAQLNKLSQGADALAAGLTSGNQQASQQIASLKQQLAGLAQLKANAPTLVGSSVDSMFDFSKMSDQDKASMVQQLTAAFLRQNGVDPTKATEAQKQAAQQQSVATLQAMPAVAEVLKPIAKQKVNESVNSLMSQLPNTDNLGKQLDSMASQLSAAATGANQLKDGVNSLVSQTKASGLQIKQSLPQLNQLNTGASQLATGLSTLNNNLPTLTNGVNQLSSGTKQLATGSQTLASSLQDGAKTVQETPLSSKTAEQIAAPVETTHNRHSDVKNYGHGLAPYFMSVSLFVGCMLFNFAYPIRKMANRKAKWYSWFASKAIMGAAVATSMALILGSIMLAVGLQVDHLGQYYGILILYANAIMFICMPLAVAFDNPGRFVAMCVLILSLGAAGGTFPIETSNGFYQTVHKFVPITYSLTGIRNSIAGGMSSTSVSQAYTVLAVTLVAGLACLALAMFVLTKLRGSKAGVSVLDGKDKLMDTNYNYPSQKAKA